MERFSGAVARDFNNLLTALTSTMEIVRRLSTDERITRLVDTADISIGRGERLVQQLLAYAGEQNLRPVAADLNALLLAPDAPWRRDAGDAVTIRVELADAIGEVLVDPDRFHAAIAALIANARDALGEAGGAVTLTTARVDGHVAVAVADTGAGMAPAIAARATEPFFTTNGEASTGLGLSEVQGFVAQSGGRLAIDSTSGEGTTITILFPVLPAHAAAPKARTGRASILVVEDDEVVRSLVVEMLEAHEYAVDAAENGTVALGKLGSGAGYDVLFTDIVMPDGPNGVELAERAQEAHAELRVLLASGYTRNHLRAQEGLKDNVRFLPKPYRMSQMIAALEALLEFA